MLIVHQGRLSIEASSFLSKTKAAHEQHDVPVSKQKHPQVLMCLFLVCIGQNKFQGLGIFPVFFVHYTLQTRASKDGCKPTCFLPFA